MANYQHGMSEIVLGGSIVDSEKN